MGVSANTNETYDVSTIREDIQDALVSITPTETIFMSTIGTRNVDNTFFEWGEVDLAATSTSNRVIEGEAAPGNDAPTNAVRKGNYTQISDKVVEVSATAEAVNGVGDAQTVAEQISFKLKELKRDMEAMLLDNVEASAGASGTARQTAGLPAFLTTNTDRGTGGADPTTSGTGSAGYPNAAATDGTQRAITETILKGVIKSCWDEGAEPSVVLCGSSQKQTISGFTGNATRYKEAEDAKLMAAIDVYVSDFGEVQIVPSRHIRSRDVFVLDPNYAAVAYLQTAKQEPLAKTGHAERRLISVEYGLQVTSEKAHGVAADIS
ncbi:MAG: SU10 major capsid protein [Alphaproteobacteria bacterium]